MVKLADIVRTCTRYNFHSHTQWCDGRAPIDVMTRAAIDAGMEHWGFSPHSPVPIASSCNMSRESVPEYLAEVKRLQQLYAGKISLYTSMEIDYLGTEWGPAIDYFQELPLDYRIASVHFVESPRDGMIDIDGRPERFIEKMHTNFDDDIRGVVEKFFTQSCRMVEAGGFDIIGHFDKIRHNAGIFSPGIDSEPWYKSLLDNLVSLIISTSITVEINTKSYEQYGVVFPDESLLPRLVEAGVPIVVNSDAHYPDKVDASRNVGLALLAKAHETVNKAK
jgi:histidinol-phosphatase (PHP family)